MNSATMEIFKIKNKLGILSSEEKTTKIEGAKSRNSIKFNLTSTDFNQGRTSTISNMPNLYKSIDQLFPLITAEDRRVQPNSNYTSSSLERFKPPQKKFSMLRSNINESLMNRSSS